MPTYAATWLTCPIAAACLLIGYGLVGCSTPSGHVSPLQAVEVTAAPLSSSVQLASDSGTIDAGSGHAISVAFGEGPVAESTSPKDLTQPGFANLDPQDDDVVGPPDIIPDCEARLLAANVKFRPGRLAIVKQHGITCGAPQVVQYLKGPNDIRYTPAPLLTCNLALSLVRFEQVLNRTANEILGARVVSVAQGGTYSCRSMARFRVVSEHSYANAIDLYSFTLSDGRTISVLRHFGDPQHEARTPETRFLRELARRAYDENVFSVVVTRFYDELHRNHIHVDMAHYHVDGSR